MGNWTWTPLWRTGRRPSTARRRWTGHSDTVNDGMSRPKRADDDGLWSPGRRALTIGLVLNVTIVASEALAVGTILPLAADALGRIALYGCGLSRLFLR